MLLACRLAGTASRCIPALEGALEAVEVASLDATIDVRVQYVLRRTQQRATERFSRPV